MSNKPDIFGFCAAGCKWQVPHKEDVEKEFDVVDEKIQTARNENESGLEELRALINEYGYTRAVSGSYQGTGNKGSANAVVLTFDFTPKLLIVSGSNSFAGIMVCGNSQIARTDGTHGGKVTWGDGLVSWYASDAVEMFNREYENLEGSIYGQYSYVAIG